MGWPNIQKPFIELPTKVKDNALKSELVNGMSVSRPRYSRQLREWSLSWNAMPNADLDSLLSFYEQTAGGSAAFSWQDQYGNSFAVRFASDIEHRAVSPVLAAVNVKLEEV